MTPSLPGHSSSGPGSGRAGVADRSLEVGQGSFPLHWPTASFVVSLSSRCVFQGNITPVIAESRLTSLATCSRTQANSLQPSVPEVRSVHRLSESQLPHGRITTDVRSGLCSPKPRGARSRQRGWAPWLQQIHRAQQQKPAALTCSPTPHLGNIVSRSLPTWFLPRDRRPQLRNPVHVCSLGCHRTRTPGQCPQLHPCEDEPPRAPNSQGAGCVYRLVMMRVRQPCSEQSEGDGITQNMNGSHLTTVWNI